MASIVIFHKPQPDAELERVDTFTFKGRWHSSCREVSRQYFAKYPGIKPEERSQYYFCSRRRVNGVWLHNSILQME